MSVARGPAAGPITTRQKRRRALAHQCASCRQLWALRVVRDEQGPAVRCRYCDAVRAVDVPRPRAAGERSEARPVTAQAGSTDPGAGPATA